MFGQLFFFNVINNKDDWLFVKYKPFF